MARKARARVHVERAERRKGWGWAGVFAGAGALVLIPPAWVLLLNGLVHGFGEFLARSWQAFLYSPAAGLPFAVIVVFVAIRERRNVDREGISLIVDEAGVYLGRARPRRIAWADIAEMALITYRVPRLRPEISTPPATRYYVAFRLHGARTHENPMRWRPRKQCESLDAIEAAAQRYAPSTPVITRLV